MKCKYTVLTFIFNDYEIVREIGETDPDAEYLLITDDPNLKSDTWRVICDHDLDGMSPYDKAFTARWNLFKYASSDICVCIDGSVQVKKNFGHLIDDFIAGGFDMALTAHQCNDTFPVEYAAWQRIRDYSQTQIDKFFRMLKNSRYDLSYRGLFTTCLRIWRRTKLCADIDRMMLAFLRMLGEEGRIEQVDQTVLTFIMHSFFPEVRLFPLSYQCLVSDYMQICLHRSPEPNLVIRYDTAIPDVKYVFNRPTQCHYLLPPGVPQPVRSESGRRYTYTLTAPFHLS